MDMPPLVWVVRHGHTREDATPGSGKPERISGWRNTPLDARGEAQAERLGAKLSHDPVTQIYTSDRKRAKETADIIGEQIGGPVTVANALRDWNLGIYTGEPVTKAIPAMLRYAIDMPETPVPGGESFGAFVRRLLTFVRVVLDKTVDGDMAPVLVTHGRPTRVIAGWLAKGMQGDDVDLSFLKAKDSPVEPGQIMTLVGPDWRVKA